MNHSDSISYFVRKLREKQDIYKSRLSSLVSQLSDNSQEEKEKSVKLALEAANDLKSTLTANDVPDWLQNAISAFVNFLNESKVTGANNRLLIKLIPLFNNSINHRWMPQHFQEKIGINFDELYQKCKSESRIDELFDNIIDLIIKIIESDDLDSIKIKNSLEGLLATLKNHQNKSYFNLVGSFDFLVSLFKNAIWEVLESIPALGPLVKALRKTIEDTDSEMLLLHTKMKDEMQSRFNTEVSFLTYGKRKLVE